MFNEVFNHWIPTKIYFSKGISNNLKDYIKGKNVLILSDPFIKDSGIAEKIGNSLINKNVKYFSEIEPNPSGDTVDLATKLARDHNTDCVLGIGGGSAMDVSKIVACLTTDSGSIYDYYSGGKRKLSSRKTQLICIPTTAGTGSEVTNVGVFTNLETNVKMPMVHDELWPDIAIIDPELTYTLPAVVTASTGMDAFCHAIESYWNKESQPISDYISLGAMKLILENIENAYKEPENIEARTAMSLASLLAGLAFSQTRTTGIHALSFPLTSEFGASHGTACSISLPPFIRLVGKEKSKKMEVLAKFLGFLSVEELAQSIYELMSRMNMPLRLSDLGVEEKDISHIAEVGLKAQIIQLTPAIMTQETVEELLLSYL